MPTIFQEKVYKACKKIPKGKVATYADIAHALGGKGYRAVGSALNKNPYAPRVPCHRVVGASGRIGGFAGGVKKKIAILKKEGVHVSCGKIVDFEKKRMRF